MTKKEIGGLILAAWGGFVIGIICSKLGFPTLVTLFFGGLWGWYSQKFYNKLTDWSRF